MAYQRIKVMLALVLLLASTSLGAAEPGGNGDGANKSGTRGNASGSGSSAGKQRGGPGKKKGKKVGSFVPKWFKK